MLWMFIGNVHRVLGSTNGQAIFDRAPRSMYVAHCQLMKQSGFIECTLTLFEVRLISFTEKAEDWSFMLADFKEMTD